MAKHKFIVGRASFAPYPQIIERPIIALALGRGKMVKAHTLIPGKYTAIFAVLSKHPDFVKLEAESPEKIRLTLRQGEALLSWRWAGRKNG